MVRAESGSVGVLFSLAFFGMALCVGLAIDYGRVINMKARLTHAVDAAALAAGAGLLDGRSSDEEIETQALEYFERNMDRQRLDGNYGLVHLNVNRHAREVSVKAQGTVEMTLTKLIGYQFVDVPVSNTARFDQRDIELGMALDVTGSMSGSRIAALKKAAKDLVDIVLSDSGQSHTVRIALAPYSSSINAGSLANRVGEGIGIKHTCVHERTGPNRFTDAAPRAADKLGRRNQMACPNAAIEPLSSDKTRLKSIIDSYSTAGATAGHLGVAWAWYLISPEWAEIFPASSRPAGYGDSTTLKAVILMSDGIFNRGYEWANGSSETQARRLCSAMKSKGVAVYAVAFQAPSSAQALLEECASGPDHFFPTGSDEELKLAFEKIAKRLNRLRLTH